MHTFARWVSTPENRSAFAAVQRVAEYTGGGRQRREINPLFLHGPPGTGKSHLVSALANDVKQHYPQLPVTIVRARDLDSLVQRDQPDRSARSLFPENDETNEGSDQAVWQGALLIVEDLQHLPVRAAETLVQMLDHCLARQQQMVLTSVVGPRHLDGLPARLVSRLACGLVAGLEPFTPPGRLVFLHDRAQRRQLAVGQDVLAWLADHIGGSGRQLEGAIARLEELVRLHDRLPDLATVAAHFREDADAARPTVERIAERVSGYFRIERRQLRSRQRSRSALVPRQVSMYLARRLTELSLEQIGDYFGGRDHSTVLHACRKIDHALSHDPALSGAVRQLQAELV